MTAKKALRKILKITALVAGCILVLILLLLILIQVPAVQNFAKNKIVVYLQEKLHTKVSVEKLSIDFPKQIVLKKVYLEDQEKDTLLAAGELHVDIAMFKLLSNTVEVSYLEVDDAYANVKRLQPYGVYNFDYIIKAFADTTAVTNGASSAGNMKFKLGDIVLKNIRLRYKDDVTGNDASFRLGKLQTKIKTFDPANSIYDIPQINIENIVSSLRQYKPLIEPKPEAVVEANSNVPINMNLQLGKINFSKINFDYFNDVSALKSKLNLGSLNVVVNKLDLSKLYINLEKLTLDSTNVIVELGKAAHAVVAKQEVKKATVAEANNPWAIEIGAIKLDSNSLKYDDNNIAAIRKGIDYNHMDITGFNFAAGKLVFTPSSYKGSVTKLSFKEKSGLQIKQMHTDFLYAEKEAVLKDLVLQTNNSTINTDLHAKYPSIDSVTKNPALLNIDAMLSNTSVAVKDILLINPALESQLKGNEGSIIKISGEAKGYINNLSIPDFSLSGYGQTNIALAGTIKGLPDAEKAYYNVTLNKFNSTKKDILSLLPKNTIPANIELPDVINTSGYFKGTVNNFISRINAKTNKGNADITAAVTGKGKTYNVKAALNAVDLGYILKQPENFGKVTLQANTKGAGTDYKTMNTTLNATVGSADIKGYTYKDLLFDATLKNGDAVVHSKMDDPNIRYSLDATANVQHTYPALKMQLNLDTLNLYALHFMDTTFTIHTNISADMASANPDSLIGIVSIANTKLVNIDKAYAADSIKLVAERSDNIQSIVLNSEAATIDWKGEYKLTETGDQVMKTIKRYYNFPYTVKDTTFSPQKWLMNIVVNPSAPLVLQFAPQLKGSDTVGAHIAFNSASNDLNIQMNSPVIQYGDQKIEHLSLSANTDKGQLDYALGVDKAGSTSFRLNKTSVTGHLANNELFTNIVLKDAKEKDQYRIAAKINQPDSNSFRIALNADSLLLNYDKWTVSKDNYIQYDSTGIIANNFALSNKEQSVVINSASPSTAAPVNVTFKDFRIKTITNFAQQDSLFMDGIINGTTVIKNVTKTPVFTSDLSVKDFTYKTDTVGNLLIKIDNQTANAFTTDVKLEGHGNDVQLAGKYYTGEGKMDMKLDINNIDLSTVKNFTAGQLKDAGGSLKGNIAIAGTTTKPEINGSMHFTNAFVTPTMLGAQFKLTNEEIDVNNEGVAFNNFTLTDSAGNKAVLNGKVITPDFVNYTFDLAFKANDFMLINSTKADNPAFYGRLNMNANVKVAGPMNAPSVKAVLRANKLTDFTFVLPTDDPEVVSREGVVNFVDMDAQKDSTVSIVVDSAAVYKSLAGLNIDVTIETDTAAALSLVIDERNGDILRVKGAADLSGGIDQSGKLTLAGNYELEQGSYQVTLSILKRKFDIQNGSVITWKGAPTDADVDITALYQINAATIDLMEAQLGGTQSDVNRYKQKIPIQVLLKMKGPLLKPQITFDIVIPSSISSQWQDVDDKLAQIRADESELNKQVFALLLLGRFTQEDPFVSAAGSSNEAIVRESVSRLLTDQLNKLASSLVKGVDLSVGLNSGEDYSTGTAENTTDLTVGVSKSLLNDRLRVSVGSNFQVEGPATSTQNTSNIAGDVSLDYQLTKDGRYRLRAYRTNEYEGVVEGQVVETGVTFVFTLDYDQFREIFNKTRRSRKKK